MSDLKQSVRRLAVVVAEQCGWLLDVDRRYVQEYLSRTRAAEGPPRRREAKAHAQPKATATRERDGPWTMTVSPQFDRTLWHLELPPAGAQAVRACLARLEADPAHGAANAAGVRSANISDLDLEAAGLPPLSIAYVLQEKTSEIYVLAVLPRARRMEDAAGEPAFNHRTVRRAG